MKLIDKSALVAEIERRKEEAESNCGGYKSYDEHRCNACIVDFYEEFLEIVDTLKVKEVQEEPVSEPNKQLAETYLAVFDKKFPILPTLKGKQLADYKDFLNKCQQIFGLKEWGIRPIQAKLFEKLSLLWVAWGVEHLQGIGVTVDGEQDEEPVSEELEDAAEDYCKSTLVGSNYIKKNAFKAGAEWKTKQFEI